MQENSGKYLLVIEGARSRTTASTARLQVRPCFILTHEAAEHAAAIVAYGSAQAGGECRLPPNPTGAKGAPQVLEEDRGDSSPAVRQIRPIFGTVLYFVTYGKLPPIDELGRPKWAYGRLIRRKLLSAPPFRCGSFRYRIW